MTLDQIRNMLRINRHRLDEELELQASIAEQISTELARLNAKQLEAGDELKKCEAGLLLDFRDSGEKLTASEVDAKIRRSATRGAAFSKSSQARHDYEVWLGMQQAWNQRSYALKDLSNLYSSDYFSQTQTSFSAPRSVQQTAAIADQEARTAIRQAAAAASPQKTWPDGTVPPAAPLVAARPRRRVEE